MRASKLLNKAITNPGGISFSDFGTLMRKCDWVMDCQNGSHRVWISPGRVRIPVQPRKDGKAKLYQVVQFLKQYQMEESQNVCEKGRSVRRLCNSPGL